MTAEEAGRTVSLTEATRVGSQEIHQSYVIKHDTRVQLSPSRMTGSRTPKSRGRQGEFDVNERTVARDGLDGALAC